MRNDKGLENQWQENVKKLQCQNRNLVYKGIANLSELMELFKGKFKYSVSKDA